MADLAKELFPAQSGASLPGLGACRREAAELLKLEAIESAAERVQSSAAGEELSRRLAPLVGRHARF
jgi:hypothetical protein